MKYSVLSPPSCALRTTDCRHEATIQSRIAWIDYTKSMGIIGVMLCHSSSKVFQSVVFVDEIIKLFFLSLFFCLFWICKC